MAARRLEEDPSDSEARVEKGKGDRRCDESAGEGERGKGGRLGCTDMQMRGGRPRVTNF